MNPSIWRRAPRALSGGLLACLLVGVGVTATPASGHDGGERPPVYTLQGEEIFPEGVATGGRYVYATSLVDGTVYRGRRDDSTLRPWLPGGADGRTAAAGIKATRTRVLVTVPFTGQHQVYDARSGDLLVTHTVPDPETPTIVNDQVIAPNGDVYVTDSTRPVVYRIPATEVRSAELGVERTLEPVFELPADSYVDGFNANGIVATDDGTTLLVVNSASGALYRIDIATGTTTFVSLDRPLLNGDGLLLRGRTLYAARNFDNLITEVRLSKDYTTGVTVAERTYPGADVPATIAFDRGDLLAVNAQFDTLFLGTPLTSPQFTVSRIDLPLERGIADPT